MAHVTLWSFINIAMENHHLYIIGKSTVNEPFSIALLNYQSVNFGKTLIYKTWEKLVPISRHCKKNST
jgi:hypothetical protein